MAFLSEKQVVLVFQNDPDDPENFPHFLAVFPISATDKEIELTVGKFEHLDIIEYTPLKTGVNERVFHMEK